MEYSNTHGTHDSIGEKHKSVLLNEVLKYLDIKNGDLVLDGTLGAGGHSLAICKKLGSGGVLIGLDLDNTAIGIAKKVLDTCDIKSFFKQENFRNMDKVLKELGYEEVDKILLDLGISSMQLDQSGRGISFKKDEPLIMTLKDTVTEEDTTAKEIVNTWAEESIADVIYGFGGERFARRIARKIVELRKKHTIETTFQLVEAIEAAVPVWYKNGRINPSTKTFQAIRMAVNDEVGSLSDGLDKGISLLKSGGRMAVISFHSVEDKIVKNKFKEKQKEGVVNILTKKPIRPSTEEIKENPRARSSKLRVIEKR